MKKKGTFYVMRKRALGDVLWIEPVVRQLAERFEEVCLFTYSPELFENYPLPNVRHLSKLSFSDTLKIKIDKHLGTRFFSAKLDRVYEKHPHMHLLEAYQRKAGVPVTKEYPQLHLSEAEKQIGLELKQPYVVVHLERSNDKNFRDVFGIDWAIVSGYLKQLGFLVIEIAKIPSQMPGFQHRKTTVRELIGLISNAALFIGIDSGPSHLAASLQTPAIVFFGAVNPDYRHFRELFKGIFMQGACEFAGCYHNSKDALALSCRIVGPMGQPPCSTHTTTDLLANIDRLLLLYPPAEK